MKYLLLALAFLPLAAEARQVVIAHRGASGYLPEHTLPAKAYAYALGVDFLEQDLVLTKDGVPIVVHDIYLDTVTDVARRFPGRARKDGRFYAIDFTLAEVKELRVTERFNAKTGHAVYSGRFPAGESDFRLSTLEEELQLIRGLNQSTGHTVGIYPELKQPAWHREQGRDLASMVLPILYRYGYGTKDALCLLQCFDLAELRRVRNELGWPGKIVLLLEGKGRGADGTDYDAVCTADGLRELAKVADGIGPSIGRVVTWSETGVRQVSALTGLAHDAGLFVHPYTIRIDELPKHCPSVDELQAALFSGAGVDGVFSDFPDVTLRALR